MFRANADIKSALRLHSSIRPDNLLGLLVYPSAIIVIRLSTRQ